MYKIEYYKEEKEKDLTYDNALYNSLNNNNTKWENYYAYLKEKYDLLYNVHSLIIDVEDIKQMKYECFSNGILLSLYLQCKKDGTLFKCEEITIPNDSRFNEELIFNILKTDWLINEELIEVYNSDLDRVENYFQAMIEVSEESHDIKVQFRNKLYSYFIEVYERIKEERKTKILK